MAGEWGDVTGVGGTVLGCPPNLLCLGLVLAKWGGDRDSRRRDDAGERVTIPNEGKRRDEVISCCDVILINYIENSMYYNT